MRRAGQLHALVLLSTAILLSVGASTPAPAAGGQPQARPPVRDTITDAQIAGTVLAAACTTIPRGQLALSKSSDPALREYAKVTMRNYTAVEKQTLQLLTRLDVDPLESALSEHFAAQARVAAEELAAVAGWRFDGSFISDEVGYQRDLLKALDDVLIPNAGDGRLEMMLASIRSVVEARLEHARKVQASLAG